MSKSAEPRAEQQARLIAMPRRESFSASAKERRAESRATNLFDCYAEARKLFSVSKRALQYIYDFSITLQNYRETLTYGK